MPANSARQLDLGTGQDGARTQLKRPLIAFWQEIGFFVIGPRITLLKDYFFARKISVFG